MQHAVKARMIPVNPVLAADRPKVMRPNADDLAFLTAEQVQELAVEVGPAHRVIVLTAAYTGLRAGELAALRVRHLDPLHGELRVEEAVSDVNGHLHLGPPKNGRTRRIALPAFLLALLAAQVEGRQADRFISSCGQPPTARVVVKAGRCPPQPRRRPHPHPRPARPRWRRRPGP
jgi:integrase